MTRIVGICFILLCTSFAWMFLGSTIQTRTAESDSALRGKVASTWGTPQEQKPAYACGKEGALPLISTRANTVIDLDHRQKGLLWYSTYKVRFQADYQFQNSGKEEQLVRFDFPLPADKAVYDDVQLMLNGKQLPLTVMDQALARSEATVPAGQTVTLTARYQSQGMNTWRYSFGTNVAEVRDFALTVKTNFDDIDFPDNSMSPTSKQRAGSGWQLDWKYANLISGVQIAVKMPEKLQPGPLAGEISYFAPVSLLFFFFLIWIITTLRRIDLHPINYFFLAAAFFAFHLLLAYLVDHISIHVAFGICSAVSIFLVVSYLRLVVGPQFAFREAALVQFVYLVLFSYAFFFKGFTGLSIAIGSIATLFVVMQLTARIRWSERLNAGRPEASAHPGPA